MQIYPLEPSFQAGQTFTLGVTPGKRFSLAIYHQGATGPLTSYTGISVIGMSNVTRTHIGRKCVLTSGSSSSPTPYNQDWNWPTVTLRPNMTTGLPASNAYAVVAYEVDANGGPIDSLGQRCAQGQPINGYPPDSDNMALVVCRPSSGAATTAKIAYIIPTATYHAYNSMGGGSFYADHVHNFGSVAKVTLRRPGGGLGGQSGEPPDPYDQVSPRQQFTHWDAKVFRWLMAQNIAFDVFTDIDLHNGVGFGGYKLMMSAGHHEYWSQRMRDTVASFLASGGNLALFSGNSCYRPVDFGAWHTSEFMKAVNRLGDSWPGNSETALIGLSYAFGGGKWGDWTTNGWINTDRLPIGFVVQDASHWIFAGTGLTNGQTFGATDHLVGYEADGVPAQAGFFNVLAKSQRLTGWDMGGTAALGIFGVESGTMPKSRLVFNCGTTDWARVLMDPSAAANVIVSKITSNVVRTLGGL